MTCSYLAGDARSPAGSGVREQVDRGGQLIEGRRPSQRVSLPEVTACGPQQVDLSLRLDPFGDGHKPQPATKAADRDREVELPAAGHQFSGERSVQLHEVQRELGEVAQRRPPGAEV